MAIRTVLRIDPMIELTDLQLEALAENHGVSRENLIIDRQLPLMHVDNIALCTERFASICQGAEFLLDRLPDNYPSLSLVEKAALREYIGVLIRGFSSALRIDDGSFSICQRTLHSHCCLLVGAFSYSLDIETSQATQWLSKAEEYVLLTSPRDDLMTLSALTNSKGSFYILQKESQLPPLSDDLQEDYLNIVLPDKPNPEWYQQLEPIEQRFLRFTLEGVTTKSEVANKIVNFSSRLRTLPGAANFRNHSFTLYDLELNPKLSSQRSASSMISSRDIQALSQEVRDYHTQQNLQQVIDQCIDEKILDDVNTDEVEEGEELTIRVPVLVQTLVSPILPALMQPDYELVNDKNRTVNNFIYRKSESHKVLNKSGETVSVSLKIEVELQSTNHSLNLANRLDYTSPEDKSCKKFVDSVKSKLNTPSGIKHGETIRALLVEYEKVLELGSLYHANIVDRDMRELYLSSLEQLIMTRMGIAYGSCVSAKDRKAIEFISTDAMELYNYFYGSWLPYASPDLQDRSKYIDLFSHFYLTRHHQRSAALSAPGSEGTKSNEMYSPADVSRASNHAYFNYTKDSSITLSKMDDRIAATNELLAIVNKFSSYFSISWSRYKAIAKEELQGLVRGASAMQLAPAARVLSSEFNAIITENLMLIKQVVCDDSKNLKQFWNSNTYYKSAPFRLFSVLSLSHPDGVKLMREHLKDITEFTPALVTQIFSLISPRLKDQDYRYPSTKEFYSMIQSLYFSSDNLVLLKDVNRRLKIFYEEAAKSPWQSPVLLLKNSDEEVSDVDEITQSLNSVAL